MSLSRIALNQQQIEAINWRNLQSLRTGLSRWRLLQSSSKK